MGLEISRIRLCFYRHTGRGHYCNQCDSFVSWALMELGFMVSIVGSQQEGQCRLLASRPTASARQMGSEEVAVGTPVI